MLRYVTHIKRLTDLGTGLQRFYRLTPLLSSPKLGPILWQLPPAFKRDDTRLRDALARFPTGAAALHRAPPSDVVRRRDVRRAARARRRARDRRPAGGGRRGNYSEAELQEWAAKFRDWREQVEVFAYFNNDWEVFAVRNALRMKELLA